jgi:hypothetical protein
MEYRLAQIHTFADLCLTLSTLGISYPPLYIRWILSIIIYPLDPIHHHISVGSYPPDAADGEAERAKVGLLAARRLQDEVS